MEPSQVRDQLLKEHEALEAHLDSLEALARQVLSGEHELVDLLRTRQNLLLDTVKQHAALEDALLAPTLRELDAWGPVRERRLEEHHAMQLIDVETLHARLATVTAPQHIATLVLAIVNGLRAKVLQEEKELLSPELLRDDSIEDDIETG